MFHVILWRRARILGAGGGVRSKVKAKDPENKPSEKKKDRLPNHPFSGANCLLVSGEGTPQKSNIATNNCHLKGLFQPTILGIHARVNF